MTRMPLVLVLAAQAVGQVRSVRVPRDRKS